MERKVINQFALRIRTDKPDFKFCGLCTAYNIGICPCLAATDTEYHVIGAVIIGGDTWKLQLGSA